MSARKARLFVIPASHPSWTARLMLEYKGIPYKRMDLVPVASKGILRAAGFPGIKVPALILDGERVQGSRPIARALEKTAPAPALFPADAEERVEVEEAEAWGDEVLQDVARRCVWNLLSRDRSGMLSYLQGARLGLPIRLAATTAPPLITLSKRFNAGTDENVRADIASLPSHLDRVDAWIGSGVLGAESPNAADFQIAPSIALLMTIGDFRPSIEGRPCAELARDLVPGFPGYSPPAFPPEWLAPLNR